VVGEEVACDPELLIRYVEERTHEPREEPEHFRVGIGEMSCVSVLAAFRPVEHAPGRVKRISALCERPAVCLRLATTSAREVGPPPRSLRLRRMPAIVLP
jgi:hypothetical protein